MAVVPEPAKRSKIVSPLLELDKIILSNLSDASTVEESKTKGVNSYLVKTDWKLDEVVAKVRETLKNS